MSCNTFVSYVKKEFWFTFSFFIIHEEKFDFVITVVKGEPKNSGKLKNLYVKGTFEEGRKITCKHKEGRLNQQQQP